jgi:hypothetical protein
MNQIATLFISATLIACSSQNKRDENAQSLSKDSISQSVKTENNKSEGVLVSTYDDPEEDLTSHKSSLKELSDSNVFSTIHTALFEKLSKNHQSYFNSKPDYNLLHSVSGDLFQNHTDGTVFIYYDKKNVRISVLTFDQSKNKYSELYRDIKVVNQLGTAKCNYGAHGTLDYQFANEIIYQRDYLIKNPKKFLENSKCRIVDIKKDQDFVLENGCFAKNFTLVENSQSLCIPTSFVYNNWECLTYDKQNDTFVIFYGQAFAD